MKWSMYACYYFILCHIPNPVNNRFCVHTYVNGEIDVNDIKYLTKSGYVRHNRVNKIM